MKILFDSHMLLWSVFEPEKLPRNVCKILDNDECQFFVSVASLWEIAIKASIGKINLPKDFFDEITNSNVNILNILPLHIEAYMRLPLIHRDPFDRILVAQAQSDQLTIATIDEEIKKYAVNVL